MKSKKIKKQDNKKKSTPSSLFENKNGAPEQLDVKTLEGWLWDAACSIRGAVDAPKFKDYILPLIFVKRLSDVYEDEVKRVAREIWRRRDGEGADSKRPLTRTFLHPRQSTLA